MGHTGANGVGRFSVEFQIANQEDMILAKHGVLPTENIRRETISGVVDSGAAMLVLPLSVAKNLGLSLGDKIQVRYADGRRVQRQEAEGAYVELLGRHGTFTAVIEPKRQDALIGAIVLEQLDFLVDPQRQKLIPRDPSGPVYEIE